MRPVVLIESPYSGFGVEGIRYLACCFLDSILRGECPIASHAIGPLALPEREHIRDENGRQRRGRDIGKALHGVLALLHEITPSGDTRLIGRVRYVDIGKTEGMRWDTADPDQSRKLTGIAREIWESGEWPTKARWASTNE